MKKFALILVLFIIASYGIGTMLTETHLTEQPVKIAIVTPVTHPSLENIERGFKETLTSSQPAFYQFKTYNAQGNKTLLRSEIEDIASKDYDLVFTIGMQASQMSKEVFAKKQKQTPIIFAAVPYPEDFNLDQQDGQITGVVETTDFAQQLDLLTQLKKEIRTLLLVYDPTQAGLVKDKQKIGDLAQERGIQLIAVEVFKTNELKQKILPFIEKADVLMMLKDNTVVTGLDTLAKTCQSYGVVLLAADLDSVDRGAGIGFGVYEYDYGKEAAKKAELVLFQRISPQEIPITPVSDYKLKIHVQNLAKQGLEINPSRPDLPKFILSEAL